MSLHHFLREDLTKEAASLAAEYVEIATNDGTYGAAEAGRLIGVGDPQYATYHVFECVGEAGQTRVENAKARDAGVGRERRINRQTMAAKRARLTELRRQIKAAR